MSVVNHGVDRIGYRLKRAQQALRGAMDAALRPALTTAQYATLSALEAGDVVSGAELARRGFVTPQTMNAILVGLAEAGLVERVPHPEHGRVIETHLTASGRKTLRDAHRVVLAIEERMLRGLGPKKRHRLADALQRCADNLSEDGA